MPSASCWDCYCLSFDCIKALIVPNLCLKRKTQTIPRSSPRPSFRRHRLSPSPRLNQQESLQMFAEAVGGLGGECTILPLCCETVSLKLHLCASKCSRKFTQCSLRHHPAEETPLLPLPGWGGCGDGKPAA